MAQTVRWGGHLVQIGSGEPLLERFRESTMADRSPDQVLGCNCFQDQTPNQFDGWVSRGQCTRSISLHNKLSVFLFVGSFSMQSFQFTNGPNLLSHYICLCPFHEEISMELCFEKQEDQDMKYQWSKCHCLDIKTWFQGLPKFNFKKRNFVDKLDPIWEKPFTTRITLSRMGSKKFPANIFFLEKRNGHRSGRPFMFGQKETY